jgi:HEAT repeat protein
VEPRATFRSLACAAAVAALGVGVFEAVTEPPPEQVRLGLYEWMATSPTVIAADIVADDGRYVQAVAKSAIKGDVAAGAVTLIDLRQANRDREPGAAALDLVKGRAYVLLLKPSTRGKKEPHPVFDLVRGVRGSRALPPEGSAATIAALVQLAAVQERNDDEFLWSSLPAFLEDDNPVLVDAALELYVKFRRESVALLPVVSPLLENPRPDVRRRAAVIVGRALARAGATELPERSELVAELTGRARRDDDVSVRGAATNALGALPDSGIEETLRAIARDDPDQDVRFDAEKAIFERSQATVQKRSD